MGKHLFTVFVAIVIGLSLLTYLFTFQVRSNEVALLHTFGKPSEALTPPGLHARWPWPIQEVRRYDNRLHVNETRDEETNTSDEFQVITSVCVGWRIKTDVIQGADASEYVKRFNKTFGNAEDRFKAGWRDLEKIVRNSMHEVVGRHELGDLVAVRKTDLEYEAIETEALKGAAGESLDQFGIDIVLLKIKRLELPEVVTQQVYARMKKERERESADIQAKGRSVADSIRDRANSQKRQIVSRAKAEAARIQADADAKAAEYYELLLKYPDVALYLSKIKALTEITARSTTTLILDPSTMPFDLLTMTPPAFKAEGEEKTQ